MSQNELWYCEESVYLCQIREVGIMATSPDIGVIVWRVVIGVEASVRNYRKSIQLLSSSLCTPCPLPKSYYFYILTP
jgi:hypothetical protein